jgi:hypothetical protein
MSTRITGYVSPTDSEYIKHSKVLMVCLEADVSLPDETAKYFNSTYPSMDLLDEKLEVNIPKHEYGEDMSQGFEVILSEIPEGVYKIRFVNNW